MKISGYEAIILQVPETDPLANMPEEEGRTRPVVNTFGELHRFGT